MTAPYTCQRLRVNVRNFKSVSSFKIHGADTLARHSSAKGDGFSNDFANKYLQEHGA